MDGRQPPAVAQAPGLPDWFQTLGRGAWLAVGIAVLLGIAFFLLGLISDLLIPLIFAAIPAAIFVPLVDRLERWRLPRWLGAPWSSCSPSGSSPWSCGSWSPGCWAAVGQQIVADTVHSFRGYAWGLTIVGLMNAAVVGLGAVVLGVPLALPIAIVTFVTSYIPFFGAFFAGAFAVLIALGAAQGLSVALAMLASPC